MKQSVSQLLQETGLRVPALQPLLPDLAQAFARTAASFEQGGQLFLCGNGGSAADCEHIAGELLKGFLQPRPIPEPDKQSIRSQLQTVDPAFGGAWLDRLQLGLPAHPLVSQAAIQSAIANDLGGELVYAQQVLALGRPGDVLLGISTSGRAVNVLRALQLAKGLGLVTIALTGADGGLLVDWADICLRVPAKETPQVQELHLPLYHAYCAMLEAHFFTAAD
jgi:D-sedoheptulose 7-phosphate isomerase